MGSQRAVIEKLVYGGQGIATLEDGKKAFVWNALPKEEVLFEVTSRRKDYVQGIATEIIKSSPQRIEPAEPNYLSTSPWQIMTYQAENDHKAQIITETFERAQVQLPEFKFIAGGDQWNYRNKMEYSFWGDDNGLHLALHKRGTRGKEIIEGSKLAKPAVDKVAQALRLQLEQLNIRAGDLKTVVVRTSQRGQTVASLFVKHRNFEALKPPSSLNGLRVYFSNPKSPASVPTKLLQEVGDASLTDTLLGKDFCYNVDSFFQVNIPIFEKALQQIKDKVTDGPVVDMFGGVGAIGGSLGKRQLTVVEADESAISLARINVFQAKVIHATSENALEQINDKSVLIVDPPRAGLHKKVTSYLQQVLPPQIVYLSCNPSTQARDIKLLKNNYDITFFEGYNFFPRTPHIESLAILQRNQKA